MTRAELEEDVADGESRTLEFKRSTSKGSLRAATETLCAFLNGVGGMVLFGVQDDGTIVGQDVSDRTLRSVWDCLAEIEPAVSPDVRCVNVDGSARVVAVSVAQGPHKPYRVRGRAFKRVGASTVAMDEFEAQRAAVEAVHGVTRWETEGLPSLGLEVLDHDEIRRTVREGVTRGRISEPELTDPMSLLRGMGLVREDNPVRAAAVLFGQKDYLQAHLPQCRVRLARFRGLDKTEFVDQRQEVGNAFQLLALADEFLRRNLPVAGRVIGGVFERQDDPVYPPEALREALANAVCHRDYSQAGGSVGVAIFDDRLEITSPGGLHFGLTIEDLYRGHDSRPWNRLIADSLYKRGIIENWGRGTVRMAQLTERAGLPRPEFEQPAGTLVVRFRPDAYIAPERIGRTLSPGQRNVLMVLASRPSGASLAEIVGTLGPDAHRRSVQTDLGLLRSLDLVTNHGHGRGARWFLEEKRSP